MSQAGANNSLLPVSIVETISGNSGGPVGPDGANNIDLHALYTNTVVGSPVSHTLTITPTSSGYPITPFVVGPLGQAGYQTIQSAINAANAANGGMIWVQPGIYTENLTLYDKILISGPIVFSGFSDTSGVFIIGVHTPPNSGNVGFNQVQLIDSTNIFHSTAAGKAQINLTNCVLQVTNGYSFNLPNWEGQISLWDVNSTGVNDGGINNPTGGAFCVCYEVGIGSGTVNIMQISGPFTLEASAIVCPANFNSGSILSFDNDQFYNTQTYSDNTTGYISASRYSTETNVSIIMSSSANIEILNTTINSTANPIISGIGAGILQLTDVSYQQSSNIASTLIIAYGKPTGILSPFVVGTNGNFSTIQSALTAASAAGGGIVFVQPGNYSENLTLYDKTQIVGATGFSDVGSVNITGIHVPPTIGSFVFRNVKLISATHIFSSAAVGSSHLIIGDSAIAVINGYVYNLPNWTGILETYDVNSSFGTEDGFVNNSGGATILLYNSGVGVGNSNIASISGFIFSDASSISCPVNFVTGSNLSIDGCQFLNTITLSNNTTGYIDTGHFITGSNPAVTMSSSATFSISNSTINSSNNPAIAGAGVGILSLDNITFLNNTSIAGTLTIGTSGGWYPPGNPGTSGFVLTSNGSGSVPTFKTVSSSGAITSITGNSGGAELPSSGNFNVLGTGSITVVGSANTETVALSGLSNHNVLLGSGTATITNVPPSATSGIPLISQGAGSDPVFGTALVAGGGTGVTSNTAYAVLCGGTTTTNPIQSIASVGTAGQLLTSNGAGALPTFQAAPASGFTTVVSQVFTGSGTYTPTANMKYCIIEVQGGGGGGGGCTTNSAGAGGGGGGGYARKVFSAASIGVSQSVTVGGTANGGAAGTNNGTTGNTSSVGILISATGGGGGGGAANGGVGAGGAGGAGSSGDFNLSGQNGTLGLTLTSNSLSGAGGDSYFGRGGTSVSGTGGVVPGIGGTLYGGGGSGAGGSTGSNQAGGNGAAGIVVITEFI